MDHDHLQRVAELTNGCNPDLVVHTGDFLTHRPGDFDAPLYAALAGISAPYGQWGCFGNHDYENPDRLEHRLRECGVTILRDRLVSVPAGRQTLEIGGLEFAFNRSNRGAIYSQVMQTWAGNQGRPR